MIPERFCTEIPRRMMRLLEEMLPIAQQEDLTTSMALMVGMPLLMIPLERTNKSASELEYVVGLIEQSYKNVI